MTRSERERERGLGERHRDRVREREVWERDIKTRLEREKSGRET